MEIDSVEVTQDFEPDNELATVLEKYSEKMEVELIKGELIVSYSVVSIERPVLLNVLVWVFL